MMYFCASSIVQQIVILIIHLLWGGGVHPLYGREGGGGVMVTDGALYGVHVYQIGHI